MELAAIHPKVSQPSFIRRIAHSSLKHVRPAPHSMRIAVERRSSHGIDRIDQSETETIPYAEEFTQLASLSRPECQKLTGFWHCIKESHECV